MEKAKKILKVIFNKYTIVVAIFAFFLFASEKHNIVQLIGYKQQIKELKLEIEQYKRQIEENKSKLEQLQSENENLEKFAREEYLMKSPDEDVFIVDGE